MSAFDGLRKKLRRRRIEGMLLAGYAFAVTCALFLSLLHKPAADDGTPNLPIMHANTDSFDFNADILTPAFNDSADDNPFDLVYNKVNNIKLLSLNEVVTSKFEEVQNAKNVVMPTESKPNRKEQYGEMSGIYQKERRVLMVEKGDTFIGLLTRLGMDTKSATEAYNVLRKVYDARNLKIGQHIELTATFDIRAHQLETLDKLVITPERGVKYTLSVNEYDKYVATVEREKFEPDIKVVSGTVNGAVVNSLINAGIPRRLAGEVINRMSYLVNFNSGIHKGDSFTVKYDVSKAANGDVVKIGNLLSATFKTAKTTYKIYRFKDNYYNEKGETKKTGLDIKPLAMRNARISSLFGYRRHPIYKTQKFHSGVDYAAPRGTAIFASGNGVVEMAQYVNGYGNYIKIRHNGEYETAYGHMQGYAKGIRKGVHVRKGQVIGYVGSTGQSTGPHLHFEILRKGQRINPLKSNVATGNDLTGRTLTEFKHRMNQIDAMKEKIFKKEEPAPMLASVAAEQKRLAAEQAKIAAEQAQSNETQENNTQNVIATAQNMVNKEENPSKQSATKVEQQLILIDTTDGEVKTEKAVAETENNKETEDTANTGTSVAADMETASTTTNESQINYKGKIVRPIGMSAAQVRQKYLSTQLPTGIKPITAPPRKPKYAGR
ncbi:MAG: M23 family metallopeptidase [Alphaproteobacteria bacterium]|nr:M23 family metallopeptidase [Alphaproteobacteria bacterium]